jgi:hypothetical protein
MATAKQIAARKKFAEMARSGALAKKRKSAAKKTVKKNPVKAVSKKVNFTVQRGNSPAVMGNPKKRAAKKTARKIPVGKARELVGVFTVKNGNVAGDFLGGFPSKAKAVEYATAYANAHGVAVMVG